MLRVIDWLPWQVTCARCGPVDRFFTFHGAEFARDTHAARHDPAVDVWLSYVMPEEKAG